MLLFSLKKCGAFLCRVAVGRYLGVSVIVYSESFNWSLLDCFGSITLFWFCGEVFLLFGILYEDYITLFYYHNIWLNFCSSWTVKPVSFKCVTLMYVQSNVNHARKTNFDQDLWAGHQTHTVTLTVAGRYGKARLECVHHMLKSIFYFF